MSSSPSITFFFFLVCKTKPLGTEKDTTTFSLVTIRSFICWVSFSGMRCHEGWSVCFTFSTVWSSLCNLKDVRPYDQSSQVQELSDCHHWCHHYFRCATSEGVRRGRGVMIGWKRTEEERRRGVQRGWKQEERNERRAREWLQMGWDWQRRDGSIERE